MIVLMWADTYELLRTSNLTLLKNNSDVSDDLPLWRNFCFLQFFKYPGINIIGQLPGQYTGSPEDKIVLIGSHYDSVDTTPGVDDNGSGMTALLQALKLYTNPG